jgi:hypothetical protein
MRRSRATALAIDACRTLLFDRARLIEAADEAGIAMQAFAPEAQPSGPPNAAPNASSNDAPGAKAG